MRIRKLTEKELALLKLVVWSAILTFMGGLLVFGFMGLRIILAQRDIIYGGHWYAGIMHWLFPLWFIFVILMIVVLMARYTARKFGRKSSIEEESEEGTNIDPPGSIEK